MSRLEISQQPNDNQPLSFDVDRPHSSAGIFSGSFFEKQIRVLFSKRNLGVAR
jgi:hypothetical protein